MYKLDSNSIEDYEEYAFIMESAKYPQETRREYIAFK